MNQPRALSRPSIFRVGGLTALYICCSLFPQSVLSHQQEGKLPSWGLNDPNSTRLAPAYEIGKFSIRPPKEYLAQTRPGPRGSKMTAWVGSPRSDGTRPQLMVLTVHLPPDELQKYNLDQTLEELVTALSFQRKNWSRTATEKGMINGLVFARTRWQGDDEAMGVRMRGFVYVAVAGDKVIQISSQDVEPHHGKALKLAESSVFTFETTNKKQ